MLKLVERIIYLLITLRNAFVFLTILWVPISSTGKVSDG